MQTRVSTKGQVVLPGPVRRRLGIKAGDPLDVTVEESRIVLSLQHPSACRAEIIDDPITGLPVLALIGPNPPVITSEQVEELLADFP